MLFRSQVKISATMLSATPTNARIQFSVRDTGIGISAQALEQLFKPFAQADNSTTRRFGGTGLGLAISGQLVNLMGGRIQVESSLGQGSHFWFELELPFERRQAEPIATDALFAREASNLEGKLAGLRLLVAEDHPVNQQIVKLMLEDPGAEVSVADNGQQALEAVQSAARTDRPFDLILMDMNMPVMMGVEATKRLRDLGYAKPVFGLSANVMQSHLQECLDAGMNGLIGKPFIREDLVHTIAQACQRSDAV